MIKWDCPVKVDGCEAMVLALCVRIRGTVYKDGLVERYKPLGSGEVELSLTRELAEEVLPHFAYLRHKIRCNPFVRKPEHVPAFLVELAGKDGADVAVNAWAAEHGPIVEAARRDLAALVDAGFRCRG